MTWTKLTKSTDNGYGWGDGGWGDFGWGGQDSIWTKITNASDSWTKITKAEE
jgi:hypothetical protein